MSNIFLSVIIVTYKNIDIVRNCLNSIKKFNDIGDHLEVIVSDNSEDYSLFNAINKEYGWVKVIKNKNEGFGAGNNRGYEISSGRYLLFLNPDTILVEPIFEFVVQRFEEDEELALFGVQLLDVNMNRNCSFYLLDKYSVFSTLYEKFCRYIGHYSDCKMFISGANLFVRRSSFEEAGCFDENIFMYLEESDLIKRIKLYSIAKKTKFFSNKKIIHLEGGTEEHNERLLNMHKRLIQTEFYYSKKWNLGDRTLKERYRYIRFKYLIYKLCGSGKKANTQKELLLLYKKALNQTE